MILIPQQENGVKKEPMTREGFRASLMQTFEQCLAISDAKNTDYAVGSDPFLNFRHVESLGLCSIQVGMLVRLSDKMGRIANLIASDKPPSVTNESVDDTIMDAINYLAILRAYRVSEGLVGGLE